MGLTCADALADSYALFLTDRDAAKLETMAKGLSDRATVYTQVCDVKDADSIASLVDAVRSTGTLGALVHAAGVSPMMAGWREVIDVDLVGTARLMKQLLPLSESGTVAICVASIAAVLAPIDSELEAVLDDPLASDLFERLVAKSGGEPDSGIAYAWAKRGVVRLCEKAGAEWGQRGARVISISPGLIDTSMGRLELSENPVKDMFVVRTPLVREPVPGQSSLPGRADDIASLVAFLCSDAASFISGCDIRVDGGLVGALRHG